MNQANVPLKSSDASMPKNKRKAKSKVGNNFDSKVSVGGLKIYDEATIQRIVLGLRKQYKNGYQKPATLPYRKNMARQFPENENETPAERIFKRKQAATSLISRNTTKFMRGRCGSDNKVLVDVLNEYIARLLNLECYANELLVKSGQPPIDWRNVWDDDACPDPDGDEVDSDDQVNVPKCDDQCIVESDGALNDNDNLYIYEPDEDGNQSGQDDA